MQRLKSPLTCWDILSCLMGTDDPLTKGIQVRTLTVGKSFGWDLDV